MQGKFTLCRQQLWPSCSMIFWSVAFQRHTAADLYVDMSCSGRGPIGNTQATSSATHCAHAVLSVTAPATTAISSAIGAQAAAQHVSSWLYLKLVATSPDKYTNLHAGWRLVLRSTVTAYYDFSRVSLQAYDELVGKLRELDALNGISGLLSWDETVSQTVIRFCASHALLHHCAAQFGRHRKIGSHLPGLTQAHSAGLVPHQPSVVMTPQDCDVRTLTEHCSSCSSTASSC